MSACESSEGRCYRPLDMTDANLLAWLQVIARAAGCSFEDVVAHTHFRPLAEEKAVAIENASKLLGERSDIVVQGGGSATETREALRETFVRIFEEMALEQGLSLNDASP